MPLALMGFTLQSFPLGNSTALLSSTITPHYEVPFLYLQPPACLQESS